MGSRTSGRGARRMSTWQVRAIYAAAHGPNSTRMIAAVFGVSVKTVLAIKHRRICADVTNISDKRLQAHLFDWLKARAEARRKAKAA